MQAPWIFPLLSDYDPHVRRGFSALLRPKRALGGTALVLLLLGSGCARYEPPPPKAPVHHALRERPAADEERSEDLKIHRAPPPAYGNKVVVCSQLAVPEG